MNLDWLIPDWPAPSSVQAVFTSRQGGFSSAPFDSLNLGDHVGDAPEKVAANRAALQSAIGSRPVFLKQVHGSAVLMLDAATADGQVADACITSESQIACTIMVADCLPVLLTTEDGGVVAAAHAGWRGLAGVGTGVCKTAGSGVLDQVCKSLRAIAQVTRAQAAMKIIAWLGPCIGPSAFEVGEDVKVAFELAQPEASQFFTPTSPGKYRADLAGLARLRLKAVGVTDVYGNDGSPAWCTHGNPSRFFSHRRDAAVAGSGTGKGFGNGFGTTGRMAAAIWRI